MNQKKYDKFKIRAVIRLVKIKSDWKMRWEAGYGIIHTESDRPGKGLDQRNTPLPDNPVEPTSTFGGGSGY